MYQKSWYNLTHAQSVCTRLSFPSRPAPPESLVSRLARKMSILSTFSYGLIAFGPMIVLFCVTVARHSHEVIVMMSA